MVIVHAVARGDVHEAGAGGVIDEVGREQPSGALAERVLILERSQLFGLSGADNLIAFPAALLAEASEEGVGHQVGVSLGEHVRVEELWIEGHGQIGGQGPGRGGPNHHVGVGFTRQTESDEHALADVVGVLHFGLGQGGPEWNAPVHGFFAPVHEALLDEVGELPQFIGLILRGEGQVRVVPVTQNTEALKLLALQVDVLAGIGIAGRSDRGRIGIGLALGAQFLGHLGLDGQAMAVPAGNVRGLESAQGLRLQDQILENLVQRRADVHIAVGEGWAVMQDKPGRLSPGRHQLTIKVRAVPLGQPLRLPLN